MFLIAVDALEKYKDAHFMGELFIKIIEEVVGHNGHTKRGGESV